MSALGDIETRIETLAEDLRAKADSLISEYKPVIHDGAAALEGLLKSPIVAEVQQLTGDLDPEVEAGIVAMIRGAGALAAKVAELTAPPAETPAGLDAEPDTPPAA